MNHVFPTSYEEFLKYGGSIFKGDVTERQVGLTNIFILESENTHPRVCMLLKHSERVSEAILVHVDYALSLLS
jgi:hypothetical protein